MSDQAAAGQPDRTVPNPYGQLIADEVKRAEDDLTALRARAISVVTTTSGLITLITGLVTFAASKKEEELGVPDASIVLIAVTLGFFLLAAILALVANAPVTVQKPKNESLQEKTTLAGWIDGEDSFERARIVAGTLFTYLESIRSKVDRAAKYLTISISLLIIGLACASASAIVTAVMV